MGWTLYAKRRVGLDMYVRAKSFVGASVLLRRAGGSPFVERHLLCQGIELLLKSILLLADYDAYRPKLRKIGHDLTKAATAVHVATGIKFINAPVSAELADLSKFYELHMLRYASVFSLLTGGSYVPTDRTLRLMEKHLDEAAVTSIEVL
jgi:hypothetical protein